MPFRVQVALPYVTGIPEDVVVNTWHLPATSLSGTDIADVSSAFGAFYEALESFLHPVLSGAIDLAIYDLEDPEPRVPVASGQLPELLAIGTTAGLPEEVAVCLSLQASLASGSPPARRRGRVFLGPFNTTALGDDPEDRSRPSGPLISAVGAAAEDLATALAPLGGLGVYSRVDEVVRLVIRCWIDNAFDTQRRRGVRPTFRDERTLVIPA